VATRGADGTIEEDVMSTQVILLILAVIVGILYLLKRRARLRSED
jgi:hypothetical protein